MGKQGSPRSPRPGFTTGKDDHHSDHHSIGRRLAAGGDGSVKAKVKVKQSCKDVVCIAKKHSWLHRNVKSIALFFALLGTFFLLDSFMVSIFNWIYFRNLSTSGEFSDLKEEVGPSSNEGRLPVRMYGRLLNLASNALAEKELEQDASRFWEEPSRMASLWKPCADMKVRQRRPEDSNGYIMVSANGGLNQQRVAICNAVAVASLLNATLVLPRFLYSNVWKDPSQFGDIYQEEHFVKFMKDEVDIVKELPSYLRSVDIEATGSLITDADIPKEAKPVDYLQKVLPLLIKNRIVHFFGFGNRLGFDPLPPKLQRLRCKCNFHALKFAPKIQQAGSILVQRIREHEAAKSVLDKQLLGDFMPGIPSKMDKPTKGGQSKYLALHLRFEVDMIAYSLCEFGGGEAERKELKAYRETHFPLLVARLNESKYNLKTFRASTSSELRKSGRCPLTPEEAALVLAGLGFNRGTYIYLAGSEIYGGQSRMLPFSDIYPNIVTKETLLKPQELAPFRNFSSQLAALDFIACATADVFAMTDSGSQLASLVSGFRTYYGGHQAPTLRPNKKRLAAILTQNNTIGWAAFEDRVRKMIEEGQRVRVRRFGRSIYRQPRCPECMCKTH